MYAARCSGNWSSCLYMTHILFSLHLTFNVGTFCYLQAIYIFKTCLSIKLPFFMEVIKFISSIKTWRCLPKHFIPGQHSIFSWPHLYLKSNTGSLIPNCSAVLTDCILTGKLYLSAKKNKKTEKFSICLPTGLLSQ